MNEILQFCQSIFNPLVIVFTVSNLLSMGLQVNLGKMMKIVGNPKFLGLTLRIGLGSRPCYRLSDYLDYFPWIILRNSIVHR